MTLSKNMFRAKWGKNVAVIVSDQFYSWCPHTVKPRKGTRINL